MAVQNRAIGGKQHQEEFMNTLVPTARANVFPKVLRYCERCRCETSHQIRAGGELLVCTSCLQRALDYELDRD